MSTEETIRWHAAEDGIVTLTLDDPGQSANTMTSAFQRALTAVCERLLSERDSVVGVIITSAKKTFFAGGDLKQLLRAGHEDAAKQFAEVEKIKRNLRLLETFGKPVVSALNGSALGGGLEIALACHHRVALSDPRCQFGFPEVTLGLLPGAGGVTRSVRMLGIQRALRELLLEGQRLSPEQAKAAGIVDELTADPSALLARARAFILANPEAKQPWDRKDYKLPGGTPSTPSLAIVLPTLPANLQKQLGGANYPAPRAILAAAVEGAQVDFDTASRIESRYFVGLATGRVAKNMIRAFFFDLSAVKASAKSDPSRALPGNTPREALTNALRDARTLGSTSAQVGDTRGLFTSRLLGMFTAEGVAMIAEGYPPASIERAATQAGFALGPLALADEVTFDCALKMRAASVSGRVPAAPHPADAVLARLALELGRKGKGAGGGFYDYASDEKEAFWPGLAQQFGNQARASVSVQEFAEMQERLLYIASLESARCLEHKLLRSIAEGNIGSIFGAGQPAWTGGALQFVNDVGLPAFVARALALAGKFGPRFRPPELLVRLAEAGKSLQ